MFFPMNRAVSSARVPSMCCSELIKSKVHKGKNAEQGQIQATLWREHRWKCCCKRVSNFNLNTRVSTFTSLKTASAFNVSGSCGSRTGSEAGRSSAERWTTEDLLPSLRGARTHWDDTTGNDEHSSPCPGCPSSSAVPCRCLSSEHAHSADPPREPGCSPGTQAQGCSWGCLLLQAHQNKCRKISVSSGWSCICRKPKQKTTTWTGLRLFSYDLRIKVIFKS